MSWYHTKLDPADKALSTYVRTLAGWTCRRCGRHATGQGLHLAHFHSRRKESVRFDLENVDSICASCHRHFTANYNDHKEWKLAQLGQKKYDLLELRANQTQKKQRDLEKVYWRQKLKELEKDLHKDLN